MWLVAPLWKSNDTLKSKGKNTIAGASLIETHLVGWTLITGAIPRAKISVAQLVRFPHPGSYKMPFFENILFRSRISGTFFSLYFQISDPFMLVSPNWVLVHYRKRRF